MIKGPKSRHKNLTCNYCKKKGHIKADCFKLQNKQKADTKGTSSEEAHVAECDTIYTLCVVDTNVDDKLEAELLGTQTSIQPELTEGHSLDLSWNSLDFTYEMQIFHKDKSVKQIGSKEVDS